MMTDQKMTIAGHLEELRRRIIVCLISVILTSGVAFFSVKSLLPYLTKPVGRLVFIAPTEAFFTYMKLAVFMGFFLSLPIILYEIWKFVSRGLKSSEKKYTRLYGPFSFLLFIAGSSFAYFVVIPIGLKFLLEFGGQEIVPMISVSKYVSFVGMLCLAFGAIFELPLVALFLTKINLVTPSFLASKRRYAVVGIFIVAALLTPPDIFTQLLMVIPLLILYEISIILSRVVYAKAGVKKQK